MVNAPRFGASIAGDLLLAQKLGLEIAGYKSWIRFTGRNYGAVPSCVPVEWCLPDVGECPSFYETKQFFYQCEWCELHGIDSALLSALILTSPS